jgi:hypothetical protein
MKRDVNAATVFAQELAEAGDDAVAVLGNEMVSIGEDLEADESPLQILMGAALGLESARNAFFKGAVAAARSAFDARRQPPVGGARLLDSASKVVFSARKTDTVAITCRAAYAPLKKLMAGSGYEPAEIREGNKRFGAVHLYFNHVGSTKYGPYKEILVLASAWPEKQGPVVEAKHPDNPFYYVVPMLTNAPYFALRVFIDSPKAEVVDFGRKSLGLDKVRVKAQRFLVKPAHLNVSVTGVVTAKLPFQKNALAAVAADLGDAFGLLPTQPPPPPRKEFAFQVVTHTGPGEPFLTWTWDFKAKTVPAMNPIQRVKGQPFWKLSKKMKDVLGPLNVEPLVSTWTFGLTGDVERVALADTGSSSS